MLRLSLLMWRTESTSSRNRSLFELQFVSENCSRIYNVFARRTRVQAVSDLFLGLLDSKLCNFEEPRL